MVFKYLGSLFSTEDSQDIIKSVAIVSHEEDNNEEDVQIITQHIVRKVQIKRETVAKERTKQAKSIADVISKVKSTVTGKESEQAKDVA